MVCKPGYASGARDVTESVKEKVYAEYLIKEHKPGDYEVDHLISLELGGVNTINNLWPQPYEKLPSDPPGAHAKDKVEGWLHWQVCHGKTSLQEAQQKIRADWYAVYQEMEKSR